MLCENAGQLQADEDEDHAVEQIDDHVPDRLGLQADAGVHDLGRFPAEVKSGGDDGEHAGDVAELVGQKIADDRA